MVETSNEHTITSFFDSLFSKTFKTSNTTKEKTNIEEKEEDTVCEESIYYKHPSPTFRRYELITEL